MRLPYGRDNKPVEAFNYEEAVDGTDHNKYLWGNAAYALGARLTNAFALYHWTAAIDKASGELQMSFSSHVFMSRSSHARFAGHRVENDNRLWIAVSECNPAVKVGFPAVGDEIIPATIE